MYIKANLNYKLNYQITQIVSSLKQFLGNDFIEQSDEKAGLGAHPYHITLIGRVEKDFNNPNLIPNFLYRWQNETDVITVNLVPIIKITNRGTIMIFIDSPYLVKIADEMICELSNNVSSYTSNLHITLGRVFNKNLYNKTINIDELYYSQISKDYFVDSFGWDY